MAITTINDTNLSNIADAIRSKNGTTTKYYTIKSGDTLYKIANKYGISVNDLKLTNKNNTIIKFKKNLNLKKKNKNKLKERKRKRKSWFVFCGVFGGIR